ncbi:alpha-ketoglutarate-dependent dioxygenase FTO [Alosa alosa]|nr:alpha-ketoglutarate-dependent dioxygenase FTO [Alosa alosa]
MVKRFLLTVSGSDPKEGVIVHVERKNVTVRKLQVPRPLLVKARLCKHYSRNMKRSDDSEREKRRKRRRLLQELGDQRIPFLSPSDPGFQQLWDSSYSGLALRPSLALPDGLHERVQQALCTLRRRGCLLRDLVRVRDRDVFTAVSRALLGQPGHTYRYWMSASPSIPAARALGESCCDADLRSACRALWELNRFFNQDVQKEQEARCHRKDCRKGPRSNELWRDKGKGVADQGEGTGEGTCGTSASIKEGKEGEEMEKKEQKEEEEEEEEDEEEEEEDAKECATISLEAGRRGRDAGKDTQAGAGPVVQAPGATAGLGALSSPRSLHYRCRTAPLHPELPETWLPAREEPLFPSWGLGSARESEAAEAGDAGKDTQSGGSAESCSAEAPGSSSETGDSQADSVSQVGDGAGGGGGKKQACWRVGLKVAWDIHTPGLALPLQSGDCYYMTDDLNRTHQHCVLAGDTARFSSTHRVAQCSTGTLDYIQRRCAEALHNLKVDPDTGTKSLHSLLPSTLEHCEEIHNEVEFEWLRQYWFQGRRYARFCSWWSQPMEQLERDWRQMEVMTHLLLGVVEDESTAQEGRREMADTLLNALTDRQQHRQTWRDRCQSSLAQTLPPEEAPVDRPYWDSDDPEMLLPFDLADIINRVESLLWR